METLFRVCFKKFSSVLLNHLSFSVILNNSARCISYHCRSSDFLFIAFKKISSLLPCWFHVSLNSDFFAASFQKLNFKNYLYCLCQGEFYKMISKKLRLLKVGFGPSRRLPMNSYFSVGFALKCYFSGLELVLTHVKSD